MNIVLYIKYFGNADVVKNNIFEQNFQISELNNPRKG